MSPVKKESTTKTTRSRAKTPSKTSTPQAATNARHIEENRKEIQNNTKLIHLLYGFIIVLMLIIAGLAFYIGTMFGGTANPAPVTQQNPGTPQSEVISITVIDDSRCSDCETDAILGQLKNLPFLSQAEYVEKDFSDKGVEMYLKENNITALPVVVFNTNILYDGGQLTPYLQALPDGQYSLALGAKFDPFAKRSDRGFLMLDESKIDEILSDVYIDGNEDAPITWIEYSDLECPFCARLHNDGTPDAVKAKYGDNINIAFQHFPLDFHPQALPAAQALECIGAQNEEVYYDMIDASFEAYSNNNFSLDGFYALAGERGINTTTLESCVESETYKDKVLTQMSNGQELFGVTGTPGNVIINTQTGEYEVVSGAYPASTFEGIIDNMLE